MSWRRRLALACGAWLLCGAAAAAAVDTLDACATLASPQARGLTALEAQCPGLESALRDLGLPAFLPEGWRDSVTRDELRDMASLAQRYVEVPAQAFPDPVAVRAVLEQMAGEQVKPHRSWWQAFKDWLRSWLGKQNDGSMPWLDRALERLAQSADLVKLITWILLGIVVTGTVLLVVRELRAAGLLSGRGRNAPATHGAVAASGDVAPDIDNLDAVALRDQPAVLLRLLVTRLLANGQLQADRSLTHRELVAHSQFADMDSRGRFERVSRLAERVLYGSADVDAAQAGVVIAEGRTLLSQLQAPATEAA